MWCVCVPPIFTYKNPLPIPQGVCDTIKRRRRERQSIVIVVDALISFYSVRSAYVLFSRREKKENNVVQSVLAISLVTRYCRRTEWGNGRHQPFAFGVERGDRITQTPNEANSKLRKAHPRISSIILSNSTNILGVWEGKINAMQTKRGSEYATPSPFTFNARTKYTSSFNSDRNRLTHVVYFILYSWAFLCFLRPSLAVKWHCGGVARSPSTRATRKAEEKYKCIKCSQHA